MAKSISVSHWFLFGSIGLTILFYSVPVLYFLSYPMLLISTLAHEMGHGLAGLLVGYHFDSFQMYSDASGVAHIFGYGGRAAKAVVAFGGLLGPSLFAALFFCLAKSEASSRFTLSVLGVLLIVADFVVVRNLFGIVFVGSLAAICLFVAQHRQGWLAPFTLVLFATQLALSVFSRGDYLFTPYARTANGPMPSDVSQIASVLILPYWFWGGVCALISIVVLVSGVLFYLRRS